MDCLLCCMVVNNEKEIGNYNPNHQVCKKAIVKLFQISGDPDVQRLSEDLVMFIGCRRKLENVVDLMTQLEELQRRVDKARIEIMQGLMVSQRVSEFMAKDFGMSKSTLDRLVLLKAIESTGNARPPPLLFHDGIDDGGSNGLSVEYGYFEVQQSVNADASEIRNSANEQRMLPIGSTMEMEVNISKLQIPPVASTVKHQEKSNPDPWNSKAGALRNQKATPKTTTVVEEVSIEGYGSESGFEDVKSSEDGTEGESGTSIITTTNGIKLPKRAYGSIIKEFTPLRSGSFQCKNCSRILTKKGSLWAHYLNHCPRRFKCSVQDCGKLFTLKEQRDSHLKMVHEKWNDFKCQIKGCGKDFSTSYIRDTHVKEVHEGRRDFKCGVEGCGKAFTRNCNLQIHLLSKHNMTSIPKRKRMEAARVISPEVAIPDLNLKVFELFDCRMTPACSYVFTSKDERNAHEMSHVK